MARRGCITSLDTRVYTCVAGILVYTCACLLVHTRVYVCLPLYVRSVPSRLLSWWSKCGQNAAFAFGGSLLEFFTVLPKWFPAKIGGFRGQIAAFAIGGSLLEFFTVLGKWFPAKIAAFRVQIASFAFVGSFLEFFTVLGKCFPAKMAVFLVSLL